jgi:hypothetical protein
MAREAGFWKELPPIFWASAEGDEIIKIKQLVKQFWCAAVYGHKHDKHIGNLQYECKRCKKTTFLFF